MVDSNLLSRHVWFATETKAALGVFIHQAVRQKRSLWVSRWQISLSAWGCSSKCQACDSLGDDAEASHHKLLPGAPARRRRLHLAPVEFWWLVQYLLFCAFCFEVCMEAKQGPIHPRVYRQIRLKTTAGFTIKHITYAWGSEFFSGFWGIYHKYV